MDSNQKLNEQIQEAHEYIQHLLQQTTLTSSVPVLLVTYMRSGSSWLGDITRQSKESFYVYEPFQGVLKSQGYYTEDLVCYYNNTCREPSKALDSHHIVIRTLIQIFACDIQNLQQITRDRMLRRMPNLCNHKPTPTEETSNVSSNIQMHSLKQTLHKHSKNTPVNEAESCTSVLTDICKKSKYRIVKTIRLSMVLAHMLMDLMPFLKIIHLVRDPRAVTNSRTHMSAMQMSRKVVDHSIALCNEMSSDIQIGSVISRKYPGHITMVMYEALSERPVDGAKYIYEFLNMKFDEAIRSWVFESTHANKDSGALGTIRSNSSATAVHWKSEINIAEAEVIQKHCKDVMDFLGYVPFQTQAELKNFQSTVRNNVNVSGFRF